ncbi:MAG: BON domain-containing protein [Blastocatellia bacterium]
MQRLVALLILVVIVGGAGYYVYKYGLHKPAWLGSISSSSADVGTTTKVKAAFGLSKRVSAYDIGVTTTDGVVTLTGLVPSEDVKSLAGEIARDTQGVRQVNNEIQIDPAARPTSESARVEDLEIRTSILESFARSPELGGKAIEVKVENRIVTLGGAVETTAQRNGAEQTARAVDGVAGVANNITVTNPQAVTEPPAAAPAAAETNSDLATRVEFELYRTQAFDTLTMKIRAEDGSVILAGTVRSVAEQLLAERIAQAVPGVRQVKNELKVASAPARK